MLLFFYRLIGAPFVLAGVPILSIIYSPSKIGGEQVVGAMIITFFGLMFFGLGDAYLSEKYNEED